MKSIFNFVTFCCLTLPLMCYGQDSIVVTKSIVKDSLTLEIESVYIKKDVDLRIGELENELDSLYLNYKIQNPSVLSSLKPASQKIKSYILDLIKNGGCDTSEFNTETLYSKTFNNSSLKEEMEKYINSINSLELSPGIKKNAIRKIHPVNNPDRLNTYTNKYNKNITALKKHLVDILWSEIYILDNENYFVYFIEK